MPRTPWLSGLPPMQLCRLPPFVRRREQFSTNIQMIGYGEELLFPIAFPSVLNKKLTDFQMRFFLVSVRNKPVGGLVHAVVDEFVRTVEVFGRVLAAQPRPGPCAPAPPGFPKPGKAMRFPRRSKAGELLQRVLGLERQPGELPSHEVRHIIGVPLGLDAVQIPGPLALAVIEETNPPWASAERN